MKDECAVLLLHGSQYQGVILGEITDYPGYYGIEYCDDEGEMVRTVVTEKQIEDYMYGGVTIEIRS